MERSKIQEKQCVKANNPVLRCTSHRLPMITYFYRLVLLNYFPHPNPRQQIHALLYLLRPCSRLPKGEGVKACYLIRSQTVTSDKLC